MPTNLYDQNNNHNNLNIHFLTALIKIFLTKKNNNKNSFIV